MQNLEKLNKNELQELLKNLSLYKDLIKKVWNRGKTIFNKIFSWSNTYTVEYYWELDKEYVIKESQYIYKKMFDQDVRAEDINLVRKNKIKGWMKIYLNDSLVDLSFLKFYNLLKK